MADGRWQMADGDAERPDEAEVLAVAQRIGLAEWRARDWFLEMQGCGWLDHQRRPVLNWQAVLARVKTKWEADGRPAGPPGARLGGAANGNGNGNGQVSNGAELVVRQKELERVEARMSKIRASYEAHQSWSAEDRQEMTRLRGRQKELNKILGNCV